jgi:transcriptional regulator with XRE-family HTH domain
MRESTAIDGRFEFVDADGGSPRDRFPPTGSASIHPGSRSKGRRVPKDSALAQFLRNRREQLQPTDVGLPSGGRRRVAGLRREEVAVLAGVSVDYYLRIEQGRERTPSDQVVDGIARALKLDDDAAAYLRDLVRRPRSGKRCPTKDLNPAIP